LKKEVRICNEFEFILIIIYIITQFIEKKRKKNIIMDLIDLRLIELVEKCSHLYDKSSPDYKDKIKAIYKYSINIIKH